MNDTVGDLDVVYLGYGSKPINQVYGPGPRQCQAFKAYNKQILSLFMYRSHPSLCAIGAPS